VEAEGEMRTRALRGVALAALLVAAAGAPAWASPFPVQVSLSIAYFGYGEYSLVVPITGAGVAEVGVTGGVTSLSLPAGVVRGPASVSWGQPEYNFGVGGGVSPHTVHLGGSNVFTLYRATGSLSNASGQFEFENGTGGGVMPLNGVGLFCLFGVCHGPSGDEDTSHSLVVFPFGDVGVGGTFADRNLTVIGAPWTVGPISVGTPFNNEQGSGFLHGPASQASTAFQPGGVVSLVTPIFIDPIGEVSPAPLVPTIGTLRIAFVPEPDTALLLGSGAIWLSLAARRRVRSGA
jgi:hypothetical protein